MKRGLSGTYTTISTAGEPCRAFVPHPLPPVPPLEWNDEIRDLLERAPLALGRLDGISALLPDRSLFLYSYVRKEAVLSSQIEGTQSSLSDLLRFEAEAAPGVPLDDVQEVSNYVAALEHGMARLREGFPISSRLLCEIHAILLSKGRGSHKQPGEFRRSQNWIGGTRPGNARHIPPPPDQVPECMGSLERFLHDDPVRTPLLLKAALAHVQFETIHPFLDGNGRLGRLLITLLLCAAGALREPMLYLSLFFKQHRARYYELLQSTRTDGDWEEWIAFFLEGIESTATQAVETAHRVLAMFEQDRAKLSALGRAAPGAVLLLQHLQRKPLTSLTQAAAALGVSFHTARKAASRLIELGIARELTGGKYGRLYAYDQYLAILSEGTEPLR